ncbi:MAG: PPOX class F420-dependent oxidoreductase [Actinomycetota bacterium]|nr:PPOX class F420-dependent oxidoreductase [Euzebyales bacterium]MDQ3030517.1 PPOX class F420-dependent oxidoreductase [Actinomycetota bacterium]
MTQKIPAAAHGLLDDANFAHVVTLMPDGMPQTTPVWIDRDGDVVVFNTAKGRAKHRNLVRDPRIALSVCAADNPYSYLQVRGRAELVEEGAREHIDKMARKYIGKERYPFSQPGEERIIVRITPESVDWHGAGG